MDTSHLAEHAGAASSFFASIFVVATLSMRTMIPLRVFAILTNILLIASAIPLRNYPTLVLHWVLLPLNAYRLHQMLQLVRDVKKSVNSDLSMEWLKPFMTERKCAAGEMLFYKDEKAEEMLYIVSGRFKLVESGIELPVGAIVGEMGMLSPSNVRTQTLECIESGLILSVSYTQVEQLYVQNPAFGFYFLRLTSARLFQNIATLEQRLAQYTVPARGLDRRRSRPEGPAMVAGVLSSLRYLFADIIGDDEEAPPLLPDGLSGGAAPIVSEAIDRLIDYQGPSYARLYVDRLRRFVGRRDVDDAMLVRNRAADGLAHELRGSDPDRPAQACRSRRRRCAARIHRRCRANSGLTNWSERSPPRSRSPSLTCWNGCAGRTGRCGPLQRQKPLGHSPPEDRGRAAAMAAVLGTLCRRAGLGRTLAAHDRPQPDQAAGGGVRDRADRNHDRRLWRSSIVRALPTGMRSSTGSPSRPSTAR